mgnify:CR=1 FL=1
MKGINIKSLALGMYSTLLLSYLWVVLMNTYYYINSFGENVYLSAILGYIEVAIGYMILLFLLYVVKSLAIRKLILFAIWVSVFLCLEVWVLMFIDFMHSNNKGEIIYFPPFLIKLLFFIYYKYREKQDYKKTQLKIPQGCRKWWPCGVLLGVFLT